MTTATATAKRCSRCKQELPVTEFCRNRARPDGRNNECKRCVNSRDRGGRLGNRPEVAADPGPSAYEIRESGHTYIVGMMWEYAWDTDDIERAKDLWESGGSVPELAAAFRRPNAEIGGLLADLDHDKQICRRIAWAKL